MREDFSRFFNRESNYYTLKLRGSKVCLSLWVFVVEESGKKKSGFFIAEGGEKMKKSTFLVKKKMKRTVFLTQNFILK